MLAKQIFGIGAALRSVAPSPFHAQHGGMEFMVNFCFNFLVNGLHTRLVGSLPQPFIRWICGWQFLQASLPEPGINMVSELCV